MKTKLISLLLVLILFSTTISTAITIQQRLGKKEVQDHPSINDASFDRLITMLLQISHYPGMSACVISNTTVVWKKGYGFSDIEAHKPATNQTIYVVASITKTITSTALMQLYEQGLFNLDDDVNMYLPFAVRNPNYPDDPITIRMILSHSSSFTSDPPSYHWFNYSHPPPIPGYPGDWLEDYLLPGGAYYTTEIWDTNHRPGAYMIYANINFDIAAYLVQLLSGQPFHEYCDDHIFKPLGMTRTGFCLPDLPIEDVAFPYLYQNRTYEKLPHYQLLHYPIGGLMTTVDDLSHFLIAHMNHGVYNGTRILQDETVSLMHTIQPPGNIYFNFHYGLGWMIVKNPLKKNVFSGHSGDIPGVHTRMFMNQSDNTGIICFFNSDRSTFVKKFVSFLIHNLLFSKAEQLTETNRT
jgi:CubicO group peptidase (beta-lactamase class C family)